MNFQFISAVWALIAGICGANWYLARAERKRWQKLERIQQNRVFELAQHVDTLHERQAEIDKFRSQPGMETVSDTYARKMLDLQAENVKLTTESNELRLEVAKYMDLYRNERYKPRQKYR
jgi:hypothetical protein